jgi:hypothetical protein
LMSSSGYSTAFANDIRRSNAHIRYSNAMQ